MPTPQPRYLTLAQVAVRTGRHPELLRQWCAASRIPCTRVGGSWVVGDDDLRAVDSIAHRGPLRAPEMAPLASAGGPRLIAAVFDDAATARTVADALIGRLALERAAVEAASVGLTPLAGLRLTVVAGRFPSAASAEARRILTAFGGRIVTDCEAPRGRPGQPSTAPRTRAALRPPNPKDVDSTRR